MTVLVLTLKITKKLSDLCTDGVCQIFSWFLCSLWSHFNTRDVTIRSIVTVVTSNHPDRLHSRRRGYSVQSRLFFFCRLFVHALKGKWLELSTPNFVHVYSIAVVRHALTQRSKGQWQGHTVTKTVTVARLLALHAATAVCCCWRRVSARRYDCLCFLVINVLRLICLWQTDTEASRRGLI